MKIQEKKLSQELLGIPRDLVLIIFDYVGEILAQEPFAWSWVPEGLQNCGPSYPSYFNIEYPLQLTELRTLHFRTNISAVRGTLGLRNQESGVIYGPWPVTIIESMIVDGYGSIHWHCQLPEVIVLPVGCYEIVDSDPNSWSYPCNMSSKAAGMFAVQGKLSNLYQVQANSANPYSTAVNS